MDSGPDSVRNLEIWGEAITIVKSVYTLTKSWPKEELYGLPREIYGMRAISRGEGSLSELETQVLVAQRQGYLEDEEAVLRHIGTVRRLLLGLIRHLKKEAA